MNGLLDFWIQRNDVSMKKPAVDTIYISKEEMFPTSKKL